MRAYSRASFPSDTPSALNLFKAKICSKDFSNLVSSSAINIFIYFTPIRYTASIITPLPKAALKVFLIQQNIADRLHRQIFRCYIITSAAAIFYQLKNGIARKLCRFRKQFQYYLFLYTAVFYRCQISLLYCSIVRSDEKKPDWLILTSIFFAHAMRSS